MLSKYNSKKVTIDEHQFDSKDEGRYYEYLKILLAEEKIKGFELQPTFVLIPKFKKNGKNYRETTYTPDFLIDHLDGTQELIDVKGFSTQQGELRRKLFEYTYPDIKLTWIARNLKHGNEHGWIEYEALKKVRSKNKKKTGND